MKLLVLSILCTSVLHLHASENDDSQSPDIKSISEGNGQIVLSTRNYYLFLELANESKMYSEYSPEQVENFREVCYKNKVFHNKLSDSKMIN